MYSFLEIKRMREWGAEEATLEGDVRSNGKITSQSQTGASLRVNEGSSGHGQVEPFPSTCTVRSTSSVFNHGGLPGYN